MPRKQTVTAGRTHAQGRRRSRRLVTNEGGIPDVYRDMLVEAAVSAPSLAGIDARAVKRRRVEELHRHAATPEPELSSTEELEDDVGLDAASVLPVGAQQTVYDDFAGSDESDADFEDVDLEPEPTPADGEVDGKKPLQLDLSRPLGPQGNLPAQVQRRKPATPTEKRLRLDVHKWHVLCLVLHGYHRNRWCDNEQVQAILKPLISRKLIALLHVDENKPQYARNHAFNKALEEISDIWRREWCVTAKGVRRAFWAEDADVLKEIDDLEDPVDLDDFKEAATTKSGSRDLGAQLFCALLRSVAVDTRLVFSLQPLPFSGVAKGVTPEKPTPQYIIASSHAHQVSFQASSSIEHTTSPSNPRWRASEFASTEQPSSSARPRTPSSKMRIKDSPFPIFWVEVFSPSIDKWIPVDPLVRHTFNKPRTGYEPPISDCLNSMSYVIAFEDDASARDVTRRYVSQYNAKTRKLRVESTKDGEKWWRRAMNFFKRPFPEMRDEIEDNELAAREVQEGMPKNVADFKEHPIFALEKHLRRNEVIYPLREAGKISSGAGAKVEAVYRRKDVHVVRSADQWYRKGRDVKEGEQPLKRATITRQNNRNTPVNEEETSEDGIGLYAEFQTDIYVPPPAVDGKIPRNAYGNLDVYVPSMIPAGAIHLQHPAAARAAKILGIDYADAVTGFDFKGRQGTAVVNGIVAARKYREALVEVIKGMELEQAEAEQEKRTNLALRMWKRLLTALRIKDKLEKEYADAGSDEDMTDPTYDENESGGDGAGGGFVRDANTDQPDPSSSAMQSAPMTAPLPFAPSKIIVVESPHQLEKPRLEVTQHKLERFDSLFDEAGSQDNEGGFLAEGVNEKEPGGFMPEADVNGEAGGFIPEPKNEDEDKIQGGGFVPDGAADDQGIGFVSQEHPDESNSGPAPELDVVVGVSLTTEGTAPPAGGSVSPLLTVEGTDGKAMPATLEKPPALVRATSALSVKDAESRISTDSIDNESLLSHDPEDDDAEPDWLVDDDGL